MTLSTVQGLYRFVRKDDHVTVQSISNGAVLASLELTTSGASVWVTDERVPQWAKEFAEELLSEAPF
jgi:hypothetical protein